VTPDYNNLINKHELVSIINEALKLH